MEVEEFSKPGSPNCVLIMAYNESISKAFQFILELGKSSLENNLKSRSSYSPVPELSTVLLGLHQKMGLAQLSRSSKYPNFPLF